MFPFHSRPPVHDGEKYHLSSAQRRFLYKAAQHEVRTDRGTPYPCSQDDLDGYVKFKHSNKQAQYITPNSATNELTRWLSEDPDPDVDAALHRLRAGLKLMPWEPDIVIKAFRDLDIAFFKGTLSGNVTVRWEGQFNWVRKYGFELVYGLTDKQGHAQCHIALCAYSIFIDERSHIPYRRMWETILHEMVHAYLFIKTGYSHGLACEPKTGTWAGSHGTHFRRCIHMVDIRAEAYLRLNAISIREDYTNHY